MYCERFRTTLTTECCLRRQERAKKQTESNLSFCESLIFCDKCPQGIYIDKTKDSPKLKDLDIVQLRQKMIKEYIKRGDFSMFKFRRITLKRRM